MNPPAPSNEEEIIHVAAGLSPDKRSAYLDNVCAGDGALLSRLKALFESHATIVGASLSTEIEAELAGLRSEKAHDRIGNYRLLQQIGEGGFGTVWMAEQEKPVQRRVAIKIIKLGMDTKEVIARFEQERQALAMMDHPNIAKVFDAGATEFGRPFFVMELVRGVPITNYCDQQKLPMRERLELFIAVCNAVQHAHQKGIIHRDLKPSNVLVTPGDGDTALPKVIDFGVAKAMDRALTDKTLFTQFEQMIGTPAYMSPEQAGAGPIDIDTRSDIYSLGVILYELLTGKPPFDPDELRKAGYDEIRRVIREEEPPRPSTRLSTLQEMDLTAVAKLRHVDAGKLAAVVRGDLDWIVMKALEKNRNRRYETTRGLAADIQRHLNNEPVDARPPDLLYLTRKFLRRRRLQVTLTALILGSLISAAALALQYRRANALRLAAQVSQLRHEESQVLSHALAGLDESEDAIRSIQACLSRLTERVRSGSGSPSDHELLARFLTRKVFLRGRRLQTVNEPNVKLWAGSDSQYVIEGVGVVIRPKVALDGTPVSVTGYPIYLTSRQGSGTRPGQIAGTSGVAGGIVRVPRLDAAGIRSISAILETQLVHTKGAVTVMTGAEPRDYDPIGAPVRIVLPPFERYFLQQLPAAYPLELVDDSAAQNITAALTLTSGRLVLHQTKRLQCELHIVVPQLSLPIPLALRVDLIQLGDAALDLWPCGLVVDENLIATMTDGAGVERSETGISVTESKFKYGIKFMLPEMPQLEAIKPGQASLSGRIRIRSSREVAFRSDNVEHFLFVPEIIQTVQFAVSAAKDGQ